jgi:hypothetical protein
MKKVDLYIFFVFFFGILINIFKPPDQGNLIDHHIWLIAGVVICSERTASNIWFEFNIQVNDSGKLLNAIDKFTLCIKNTSSILPFYIPISQPLNFKETQEYTGLSLIKKIIHPIVHGVLIISFGMVILLSNPSNNSTNGLFSQLVSSEPGTSIAIFLSAFLAWWAMSFTLLSLGLFFRRKL